SGGASNRRLRITAARPRVEFGMARAGAIAHRVKSMSAHWDTSRTKVTYSAFWQCNNLANDMILLPGTDGLEECRTCKYAQMPVVYHYFDVVQRLIYIGSADNYVAREMTHQCRSPWWLDVASVRLTRYPSITHARVAERVAIRTENPLHNGVGKVAAVAA